MAGAVSRTKGTWARMLANARGRRAAQPPRDVAGHVGADEARARLVEGGVLAERCGRWPGFDIAAADSLGAGAGGGDGEHAGAGPHVQYAGEAS